MSDEEHFESQADAGASKTYPQQSGTIRKNGYIVIKGRPCQIISNNRAQMGNSNSSGQAEKNSQEAAAATVVVPEEAEAKPKKKICCACPETKKLRDECIVEHGEDKCSKFIEAHKQCLRAEGFNV